MSERFPVSIPKVSMAAEDAIFVEWLVGDGDSVNEGQPIYSVSTDKVEVEVEAGTTGVLRHGTAEAEETYPVGTEIGFIETSA